MAIKNIYKSQKANKTAKDSLIDQINDSYQNKGLAIKKRNNIYLNIIKLRPFVYSGSKKK